MKIKIIVQIYTVNNLNKIYNVSMVYIIGKPDALLFFIFEIKYLSTRYGKHTVRF